MIALYFHRRKSVTLAVALKAAPAGATALVYTPGWCGFAIVAEGRLADANGRPVEDAYEVRAFNETMELRWLNDPATQGTGAAAIITETELDLPEWEHPCRLAVIDRIHQTYLLWGEGTGHDLGTRWSQLAAARIGALPVPIPGLEKNDRVFLKSFEYVAADEFGSAYVCEERLTGLTETKTAGRETNRG